MAGGKLTVEIGADITDFEKKIKEVEFDIKELSKVKLDRLKLGLDTTEINAQIKDAKNNLNSLKTAVKDTGQSFSGMAPKVANGGNALTQFGRIAQDAPFGIIGIGNNITATAEAFGDLKNSTGSTGGALKALGQSLAGTGGIILGVSLLTAGLTYLAQSGLSVGDVIDKMTGKFDALSREMQKATEEAAKNSGAEVANMKALVSVAQDDTLAREKRLIAVQQLQKQFPAYFASLSTEKILSGDLTAVTKELTDAIVARAKASAFAGKIGELASKELVLNAKLVKEKENLIKLEEQLAQAQKNLQTSSNVAGAGQRAGGIAGALALQKDRLQDIRDELKKNKDAQDSYTEAINKSTAAAIKLSQDGGGGKAPKTFVTPQVSGIPQTIVPAPLFDVNEIETFNGQVDQFGNKIKELPGVIKGSLGLAREAIITGNEEMLIALADFNSRASQIIENSISETFAGIGEAIGNALASGGSVLEGIGLSLLDSLGSLLVQMGKMAIQVGVGLLAIKTALKSLNPAVAIGAGVALVALGSLFSSKSNSLSGSIGGGGSGVSGGSGSGANNQSFSSSGFSSRGDGGGTVVFEIAGQKLIGVLSNTLNANRRLGGSIGL